MTSIRLRMFGLQQVRGFVIQWKDTPHIFLVSNLTAALTLPLFINEANLRDVASDDIGRLDVVIRVWMVSFS